MICTIYLLCYVEQIRDYFVQAAGGGGSPPSLALHYTEAECRGISCWWWRLSVQLWLAVPSEVVYCRGTPTAIKALKDTIQSHTAAIRGGRELYTGVGLGRAAGG